MGLFSSKKTTVVSSTVYNMAGDEAERPHFIKNSIYGAIMSPFGLYLGETLVHNHLAGPGMNQRRFFNWAKRNNYPGLPTYSVSSSDSVDPAVVAPFIPTPGSPAGLLLSIQTANMVSGDYSHVVEKHVLENFPANYDTAYVTSYDKTTNDITINWFGGGTEIFSAGTWTKDATYVVATYYHYLAASVQSLITGSTTVGATTKPATGAYGLDSSANTGVVNYPMNYDERIITTYTGAGAPSDTDVTTSESDSVNFDGLDEVWSKILYEGGNGVDEAIVNKEYFLHISEYRQVYTDNTQVSLVVNPDTPSAGITQTIETRRINDHLRPVWDWREDTQDTIGREIIDGVHVFVYEIGTGNATLDAIHDEATVSESDAEYFPYMPIRLNNVSITHAIYDDITGSELYTKTNRAYRRASGGGQSFAKLVDEVEENVSIDDIDYAFTHHGVGLNVLEPACRKYIYTWFKNVSAYQNTNSTYMTSYKALVATYESEIDDMNAWVYAQADSGRFGYGDARPPTPELVDLKTTTVRLRCADAQLQNLDNRISWVNITETLHTGVAKTGATVGEIWFEGYPVVSDPSGNEDFLWEMWAGVGSGTGGNEHGVSKITLYWQTGTNAYKKLTMWGLVHNNLVYNGESVEIGARAALTSTDPTGFIIPLHYQSVKDLGLVDATQMATANTFIVFNSYEVVKQRWYQGFVGMLIIFVAIVALSLLFPPAGGAMGILGSNAAVGAAMGLTGTAALVAGAITNALVAIVISQIVTHVSVALLGDKWGAIVAAVVNLAISLNAGGFDFSNFSDLGTTANILKITSAVSNGYAGYVQGAVAEIGDEMQENVKEYEGEEKKIAKMLSDLRGGTSGLNFNPLALTDSIKGNASTAEGGYNTETLDEFIHRTMLVGSEIVDISLSMVNNFADLSIELPS